MSLNTNSKPQGKKQDPSLSKQSRGKKWSTNNNNTSNGASARGGNYHTTANGASQTNINPSPMTEDPELIHHMHDRMLFLLGSLYGSKVQVTVRNGTTYEGIFQGATTEGDLDISLTFARKIHDPTTLATTDKSKLTLSPVLPSLLIFSKDLMGITALDTDLTAGEALRQEKDSFKTDTDISGKGEIKERELHKWNPELPEGEILESLESSNGGGSWDQFTANEKLFGLTTDFDEELYTTRLDRSAPDYKDREKWAIEKANEIQRSATNNPHMLEERNITTTDGLDEEDKYGAVVRDVKEKEKEQPGNLPNFSPDNPLFKLTTGTLANVPPSRHETGKLKKQPPKRIESEIASTFRQFAMLEKDKLQAKRQALHRKEQSDRLAELVKFHKSFKLTTPVPPDMLPLLAKSKKSPTSSSQPSEKTSPESNNQSPQKSSIPATRTLEKPVETTLTELTGVKKPGFKFNIKATEFKPNPTAPAFVPGGAKTGASDESATARPLRKSGYSDPLTIDEIFQPPFSKEKNKKANTIGPTWPYGSKQYRHQYSTYSEDIFTGYSAPPYGYGYPQYRYHQQQYVPGMPYMSPQFVPPISNAPIHHGGYSPQMANGSPHGSPFSPQGYSSPQRSPMPPPNGIPPQVYPYQDGPMRYTPEMMTPPSSVMVQRIDPKSPTPYHHYSPDHSPSHTDEP